MGAAGRLENTVLSWFGKSLHVGPSDLTFTILIVRSISPLENSEIFWRSPSSVDGTPVRLCRGDAMLHCFTLNRFQLELGQPWTDRSCQWVFEAVCPIEFQLHVRIDNATKSRLNRISSRPR